jgi:type I restriction enzyme M protein
MATELQEFSRTLFAAADQLWANSALLPDQYAQPVLALIALRQMEAKFEAVHLELAPQHRAARDAVDENSRDRPRAGICDHRGGPR